MTDDMAVLTELNVEIGRRETRGDPDWFEKLATKLAFQRANDARTIVDAGEFLNAVKPGPDRDTEIESIQIYGDRALVSCVVTMRPDDKRFHNLRLFVRREKEWKLLGWANEPA
jgi:hypothetical protein